jgi:Uncharacterized protein conserved in archaea
MRSVGTLGIVAIALIIFISVSAQAKVIQQVGDYTVSIDDSKPVGIVHHNDAYGEKSFLELPLWIQMMYLSGIVASLLVALKLLPFVFLKLKGTIETESGSREKIYAYIEENPGCTVTDIARAESLNTGSVRYHVYRLELARKIREIKTSKFVRMFKNNGVYTDREITVISALNIRTNGAIVALLGTDPGLSNKQIADRLKIKASQAHAYLSDLLRDRIIRFEECDRRKVYYLESDVYVILEKTGRRPPADI